MRNRKGTCEESFPGQTIDRYDAGEGNYVVTSDEAASGTGAARPCQISVSIVVPVYDEQHAVAETARLLLEAVAGLGSESEIIFVDDGSKDGTSAVLGEIAGIRVVRHRENRGYGAAIKTGIRIARNPWIAITDADGTYPSHRLPDLFAVLCDENLDMVVGARTGGNVHIPWVRRPAKWFLGKLSNFLSGRRIPDLNSGFRIIRRSVLERYLRILPDGFSFTSTITLAMLTNGLNVGYVPIDYHQRSGKSKIRPVYDTLNFLQLILRVVLWFNPLRVFIPLSLLTMLASFAVLAGSWYYLPEAMDVTFGVLFMTSVLILAVGLLADMIDKRT